MRTLVSSTAASMTLLAVAAADASGPSYFVWKEDGKYWILLIVILLILNLVCCWRGRR